MSKARVIKEAPYGVYVWRMPNGSIVADEDRNWLSINAMEGDIKRIAAITRAARSLGIEEGEPIFLSGHRKVTDEEYEEQTERLREGKIPDQYDIPAYVEEANARKQQR